MGSLTLEAGVSGREWIPLLGAVMLLAATAAVGWISGALICGERVRTKTAAFLTLGAVLCLSVFAWAASQDAQAVSSQEQMRQQVEQAYDLEGLHIQGPICRGRQDVSERAEASWSDGYGTLVSLVSADGACSIDLFDAGTRRLEPNHPTETKENR